MELWAFSTLQPKKFSGFSSMWRWRRRLLSYWASERIYKSQDYWKQNPIRGSQTKQMQKTCKQSVQSSRSIRFCWQATQGSVISYSRGLDAAMFEGFLQDWFFRTRSSVWWSCVIWGADVVFCSWPGSLRYQFVPTGFNLFMVEIQDLDFDQNLINPFAEFHPNLFVTSEVSDKQIKMKKWFFLTLLPEFFLKRRDEATTSSTCCKQSQLTKISPYETVGVRLHVNVSCSRGPAGPEIPQLLILAAQPASRSGSHYVFHGLTTCGPSCLLLLDIMVSLLPDSVGPVGRNLF